MQATDTPIYDLANAREDHPLWFAKDAARFFGTRIHEQDVGRGVVYVVTSEQPPHSDRTWNVRRFTGDQHRLRKPQRGAEGRSFPVGARAGRRAGRAGRPREVRAVRPLLRPAPSLGCVRLRRSQHEPAPV